MVSKGAANDDFAALFFSAHINGIFLKLNKGVRSLRRDTFAFFIFIILL
jgi:hypothetical protein